MMGIETNGKDNNSKKFEGLLIKRKQLSSINKNNVCKVSSNDSQLSDIIKNFNEGEQYQKNS